MYPPLLLFLPHYDTAKLGGNDRRSGLPFMSDDAGTPFAVTIVPMDKSFAVKAKINRAWPPGRREASLMAVQCVVTLDLAGGSGHRAIRTRACHQGGRASLARFSMLGAAAMPPNCNQPRHPGSQHPDHCRPHTPPQPPRSPP